MKPHAGHITVAVLMHRQAAFTATSCTQQHCRCSYVCTVCYGHVELTTHVVWLARLSLSAQSQKVRKGRDGLAYIAISSHLAA